MTRFAAALKRENLSQSDVARALGISHQSVNEWAMGRRPIPAVRQGQIEVHFPVIGVSDLRERMSDAQG